MSGKNRKTGNLVALGSAAVVAVYGAGFMRTAAAAERFATQSNDRRLSPEEAEAAALGSITSAAAATAGAGYGPAGGAMPLADSTVPHVAITAAAPQPSAVPDDAAPVNAPHPGKFDATTANAPKTAGGADKAAAAVSANSSPAPVAVPAVQPPIVAAPLLTAAAATVASAPVSGAAVQTATTPPVVTERVPAAVTTPAVAIPAPVPVEPVPAPAAAPAENKPPLKWKDGSYTGYGQSRHGDIEVYLETEGGKITFIKISQCLTQYSCSWIGELPGQVIARQSAQVDAISGATQSANAFYYAVVQALAKAK